MTTLEELRERVIGETAIHVVGVDGVIEAYDADTITIGGITLPTHLHGPVRYLSVEIPTDTEVDPEDLGYVPEDDYNAAERQVAALSVGIETLHAEHHQGVFRTCLHEVCRRVRP